MSLRLALTAHPVPGEAVTVGVAARLLGCDPSTVRKLLQRRRLAGHRVGLGKRGGVRIDLGSVHAYKASRALGAALEDEGDGDRRAAPRRLRGANPAHDEAMAYLRSQGVRV